MRSRRRTPAKQIEIPPYFPPSRHETSLDDPVIDYDNHKILSLPSIVTPNTNGGISMNHFVRRSVEEELLNEVDAVLGEPPTSNDSSGVHPGILYGGPAGGLLAPIGVYFYKLFKKRRRKKKQSQTAEVEHENEDNSERENITSTITNAVSNQITNAGSSVVSHIKGKIAETGSSLVQDLKAQAIAQEEEILQNIKTTILEQEKSMLINIKQKFADTRQNLVQDLKNKMSIFGKAQTESIEVTIEPSTSEEKRKQEETLYKVHDSEELMNTVKRRISNAQDALIPEIERSIEATDENIIRNIEKEIPEARGPTWNKIKSTMKDRSASLFNEIKSILTCTEKKIIDDVKSQIGETTSDTKADQDEVIVEIVQPEVTGEITYGDLKQGRNSNKSAMQNGKAMVSGEETTLFEKIKYKIFSPLKHSTEELSNTTQTEADADDAMEEIDLNKDMTMENENGGDVVSQVTLEGRNIDIKSPEDADKSTIPNKDETVSSKASNVIKNIKHKVSIPLQFLKHTSTGQNDVLQTGADKSASIEETDLNYKETDQTAEDTIENRNEEAVNIIQPESNQRTLGEPLLNVEEISIDIKDAEGTEEAVVQNEEEIISSKGSTMLSKIKHKVSIPLHFLKHSSEAPNDSTQTEPNKVDGNEDTDPNHEDLDKTVISTETIQRTSPIPIPVLPTKLDRFPVTQEPDTKTVLCDTSSSSSNETEEDKETTSFFDKIKNSVPYLPLHINFSGIPEKVMSFIEPRNLNDTNNEDVNKDLSEVKIVGENMDASGQVLGENQETNDAVENTDASGKLLSENLETNEEVQYTETNKTETAGPTSNDGIHSSNMSTRKWIVLDYTDESWPSHLPRNIGKNDVPPDSKETISDQSINTVTPSNNKWLQLVAEDAGCTWPNHLPKNLHGLNGTPNHEKKGKHVGKHKRSKGRQLSQDDSDSPDEDDKEWRERLSKNLLSKPMDNGDDRKESIVSTTSEFSTTSSVDSTSSGTLESRDSFSGHKLPNFDSRLQKNRERNKRLKSLDSGIHHYYGEYIAIEFPITDSDGGNQKDAFSENIVNTPTQTIPKFEEVGDQLQISEGGSSENSQEEVRSVISTAEVGTKEETDSDIQSERLRVRESEIYEGGGGYYEGCIVSLEHKKIQQVTSEISRDNSE